MPRTTFGSNRVPGEEDVTSLGVEATPSATAVAWAGEGHRHAKALGCGDCQSLLSPWLPVQLWTSLSTSLGLGFFT